LSEVNSSERSRSPPDQHETNNNNNSSPGVLKKAPLDTDDDGDTILKVED